jgi:hypothetical protein
MTILTAHFFVNFVSLAILKVRNNLRFPIYFVPLVAFCKRFLRQMLPAASF